MFAEQLNHGIRRLYSGFVRLGVIILIRVYLAFLILTALFWVGLSAFRRTTGKEKWQLTKIAAYSILCSALAVIVLTLTVILF